MTLASRQEEIPFYKGIGGQPGRRFGALAQIIGRTAVPFLRVYIVPLAKHVGAGLLELAVPEIADVDSGKKNFKTAAKSVGRQTLNKQLSSGCKKASASRFNPTKSATETICRKETFYKTFLINYVE